MSSYVLDHSEQPEPTAFKRFLKKIECPVDPDAEYQNDQWTNRDLIPMPKDRRTYRVWSFAVYWAISGACISAYTTGSSILALGLTAPQAVGAVVVAACVVGLLAVGSEWPGKTHHIGYTVLSRSSWGFRGTYFVAIMRVFTTVFWDGIQAYWGGQAIRVCIGAMSLSFSNWDDTLADGTLLTKDLICMVIFYVFFLTIMYIPPEKMQKPFLFSSACFVITLIGLLAWSVSAAGGAGPLWSQPGTAENPTFAFFLSLSSIMGSWGGGTKGQSDWTRYSKTKYAPTVSQLFLAPIMIIVTACIGIIVTSASSQILGRLIWRPFDLMSAVQVYYDNSPGVRAGVFFASFGCACAQLGICVVLNSVSAGMDLSAIYPKYINIRRAAYMVAALGVCCNPWRLLSTASTFLSVISGFGVFHAPFTGVMWADYFIVRRKKLVMPDLYRGDSSSIYWFNHGLNWRAAVAWTVPVAFLLPGFAIKITDSTSDSGWVKLFNLVWFFALPATILLYWGICTVFPPSGLDHPDAVKEHTDDMVIFPPKEKVGMDLPEGAADEKGELKV